MHGVTLRVCAMVAVVSIVPKYDLQKRLQQQRKLRRISTYGQNEKPCLRSPKERKKSIYLAHKGNLEFPKLNIKSKGVLWKL